MIAVSSTCRFVTLNDWQEAGIEPSVGSVGDSYDNALAETINGLYKTEVIRQQGPWRNIEDVEFATLTWVDWFNNRRILRTDWQRATELKKKTSTISNWKSRPWRLDSN